MDNRPLFQARWSWGPLAACTLLPIALLCFWLWPFGQILCLSFDEWLFRSLNAPLADNTTWRISGPWAACARSTSWSA